MSLLSRPRSEFFTNSRVLAINHFFYFYIMMMMETQRTLTELILKMTLDHSTAMKSFFQIVQCTDICDGARWKSLWCPKGGLHSN